jgi:hypothetical protein
VPWVVMVVTPVEEVEEEVPVPQQVGEEEVGTEV